MYEIRDNQMKAFLWCANSICVRVIILFYKTVNAYNL